MVARLAPVQLPVRWLALLLLALVSSVIQPGAQAAGSKQVRILSTNDIHFYLRPVHYRYVDELKPWGPQPRDGDYVAKAALEGKIGGMAHLTTVVNRLRAEKPGRTILVDAGDTWHGSALSVFDKGKSMVKIMNAIGYEVMAPGNWEFFYPKDHLLDLIDMAEFPVIAYNLTDKEWGDPVLPQYVIKQVGDVKIAFVGLTYPWTGLTSAVSGAAKWFNFGIKEDEARALIQKIRETEDPDLIVFVSHGGYGLDQKFASRVDGIDTLISGHTHDEVFDPVVWNNTLVYQGGAHAKFVTSLDIEVRDKKIVKYEYELVRVNQDQVPADPKIKALVDEAYRPHRKVLDEVVGQTDVMLYRRDYWQSPMGNMITDALREIAGTDVSLFPAWRYGATLLPGRITAEDIYNVVPTDGRIITYDMSGKAMRELLENILGSVVGQDPYARVGGDMIRFSGLKLVYDLANPAGKRIVSLTVNGKPFSADKEYRIASVHTRFQNNRLFGATNIKDTGKVFVEELIEYIRAHSPITATRDDRIGPKGSSARASP